MDMDDEDAVKVLKDAVKVLRDAQGIVSVCGSYHSNMC